MDYCRVCFRLVGGLKAIPIDPENHPAMSHKDILIGALDRSRAQAARVRPHRSHTYVAMWQDGLSLEKSFRNYFKGAPDEFDDEGKISFGYCEAVSINLREVSIGTRL